MNIAHLLGTSTSSALEAVYGQRGKKDADDGVHNGVYSWRQDRVNISEAAIALLEQAGKEQAPPEKDSSQESLNEQGASLPDAKSNDAEATEDAVASSGGGGQGSLGGASRAADIEAKIKALQQQIFELQNSDLPEDAKSAMISALQSQISQLIQEKSALEVQAGKA